MNLLTCAYYYEDSSSSVSNSMARSLHVSWNHNKEVEKNNLRSSLVTTDNAETVALMNELDEDDLADEVKANDDLIKENLRSSNITRISEIGVLNTIRITEASNINL